MTDLLFYETGDGGDLLLRGNDFAQVFGVENTPYLAMFAGSDWWGNYTLPTDRQIQSKTEDAIRNTPLSSAGRLSILDAVDADLTFLSGIPGTKESVDISVVNSNRLDMVIKVDGKTFSYEWNPDKMFLTYQV